ncbi:MAG: hypothetical protein H8F28_26300 [Fibrella sp.]|nr:hypothetical protein [Armatimonadota bacterium]
MGIGQTAYAQKKNNWSLQERERAPLSAPYRVGALVIRPPRGFTFATSGDRSERSYFWLAKPIVEGQPATAFVVTTMELPAEDRKEIAKLSAEEIAVLYAKNFFKSWHDVKQSSWTEGTINGMRFVRSAWWATNKSDVKAHGIFYVTLYKGIPYICASSEPGSEKDSKHLRVSDQSSRSCTPAK